LDAAKNPTATFEVPNQHNAVFIIISPGQHAMYQNACLP
jgi:hypothetical protein